MRGPDNKRDCDGRNKRPDYKSIRQSRVAGLPVAPCAEESRHEATVSRSFAVGAQNIVRIFAFLCSTSRRTARLMPPPSSSAPEYLLRGPSGWQPHVTLP